MTDTDHELDNVEMAYHCGCGEIFSDEQEFRRHHFEEKAQAFIEEYFGDPFAAHHERHMKSMGNMTAYDVARELDLDTRAEDDNAHRAAVAFCRDSLIDDNVYLLVDDLEPPGL